MVDDNQALSWRPIETAPRDKTPILVVVSWRWANGTGDPSQLMDVAHFDPHVNNWVFKTPPNYHQMKDPRHTISHWMPLPAPPTSEAQS